MATAISVADPAGGASYGTAAVAPSPSTAKGAVELTADEIAKREQSESALWKWNLGCGILHLIQGIIVLIIGA